MAWLQVPEAQEAAGEDGETEVLGMQEAEEQVRAATFVDVNVELLFLTYPDLHPPR